MICFVSFVEWSHDLPGNCSFRRGIVPDVSQQCCRRIRGLFSQYFKWVNTGLGDNLVPLHKYVSGCCFFLAELKFCFYI